MYERHVCSQNNSRKTFTRLNKPKEDGSMKAIAKWLNGDETIVPTFRQCWSK